MIRFRGSMATFCLSVEVPAQDNLRPEVMTYRWKRTAPRRENSPGAMVNDRDVAAGEEGLLRVFSPSRTDSPALAPRGQEQETSKTALSTSVRVAVGAYAPSRAIIRPSELADSQKNIPVPGSFEVPGRRSESEPAVRAGLAEWNDCYRHLASMRLCSFHASGRLRRRERRDRPVFAPLRCGRPSGSWPSRMASTRSGAREARRMVRAM